MGLGLRAFAALIAAFGLLMLELSAYFALGQIWSAISAAAILAWSTLRSPRCRLRSLQGRRRDGNLSSRTKSTALRSMRCNSKCVRCSWNYPE
jgi:hypothetical protein